MKVIRWMEVPLPVHQLRAVGAVAISAAQTDECYCRKPQLTMVVQAALSVGIHVILVYLRV